MVMIKKCILVLVSLILLSSSCISIKKFDNDDLNVINTLRDSSMVIQDSMEVFSWKDIFVDRTIQSLIQEGIVNNSDIIIARENIVQSQQYLKKSKWDYAPTFNGSLTSGYNHSAEFTGSSFIGANLSWEPDIWGKITAKKRAAYNSILRDISAVRSIQSELVANIAILYYQLLALDDQLELVNDFLILSESTVKAVSVMRDNGMSNSAAVEQAKAQYFSAMASVPEIENAIFSTESALSILIGRSSGDIVRGESSVGEQVNFVSKGFPFHWVSNRPDVKTAEYSLIQIFNIKEASKASMYPTIRLGLDVGVGGASMYNFVSPANFILNFLGGITAPIFNGRALKTEYKVNTSRQRQAVEEFEKVLRLAGAEVSETMYAYEKLILQVGFRENEVAANLNAVNYTNDLMFNGMVTYLEVLSAQSNYLSSSINSIKDKFEMEKTYVQLYKALGGGWF